MEEKKKKKRTKKRGKRKEKGTNEEIMEEKTIENYIGNEAYECLFNQDSASNVSANNQVYVHLIKKTILNFINKHSKGNTMLNNTICGLNSINKSLTIENTMLKKELEILERNQFVLNNSFVLRCKSVEKMNLEILERKKELEREVAELREEMRKKEAEWVEIEKKWKEKVEDVGKLLKEKAGRLETLENNIREGRIERVVVEYDRVMKEKTILLQQKLDKEKDKMFERLLVVEKGKKEYLEKKLKGDVEKEVRERVGKEIMSKTLIEMELKNKEEEYQKVFDENGDWRRKYIDLKKRFELEKDSQIMMKKRLKDVMEHSKLAIKKAVHELQEKTTGLEKCVEIKLSEIKELKDELVNSKVKIEEVQKELTEAKKDLLKERAIFQKASKEKNGIDMIFDQVFVDVRKKLRKRKGDCRSDIQIENEEERQAIMKYVLEKLKRSLAMKSLESSYNSNVGDNVLMQKYCALRIPKKNNMIRLSLGS